MPKYKYAIGTIFEIEANSKEEADELAENYDTSKLKVELVPLH